MTQEAMMKRNLDSLEGDQSNTSGQAITNDLRI